MRRTVFALAALSTALVSSPAFAEPIVLKPSSPWNVDFGEEKCRLARFLGGESNRHVLIFEQYWPEQSFLLTVAGSSFKSFRSSRQTEVSFRGEDSPFSTYAYHGVLGDYGEALIFSRTSLEGGSRSIASTAVPTPNLRALDVATAKQVQAVTFAQGETEVKFLTAPLDEAFNVLNACTEDLVASWGFDPAMQRTATRSPQWINQTSVTQRIVERYPSRARNNEEEAILRMRVNVSAEGQVEDCFLVSATANENLESPACKEMKRARFEPALDAQGLPMRSYYTASIIYRLN